jgi:succinate dehydrogenase / fumarate reductase flavoprotein subunit
MKPDMKGQSLYDYFEAKNSIMTAIAVLLSASARKESRGPHLYFNSMEDLIPLPSLPEYQHYFTVSYGQNGWHVGKGR